MKTRLALVTLFGLLVLSLANPSLAGAIKTFANGDVLSANDLNSNFTHIHNLMVGGHGARLKDADVSAVAAIAHTKLAQPKLVPKAWTLVNCDGGSCVTSTGYGVASATRTDAGTYTVTILSGQYMDANHAVFVNSVEEDKLCRPTSYTSSSINITCRLLQGGNANFSYSDTVFNFLDFGNF